MTKSKNLAATADTRLFDRIGELTGYRPGNVTRGHRPLGKAAMSSVAANRVRNRLGDLLRKSAAAAGPSTNQQFSESFAAMAFTFLDERSPSLRDFMVGFQVVDKGDDGQNAFGVFGFQLPTRVVQCPVFFMNGQIKGYQLMFVPDQQLFMPLHEGFVNRLINGADMANGQPGPAMGDMSMIADPSSMAGRVPNVLKRAEIIKQNSWEPAHQWAIDSNLFGSIASWIADEPTIAKFASLVKGDGYKSDVVRVDELISSSEMMFKVAATLALQYPAFAKAIDAHDMPRMRKLAADAAAADARRCQAQREAKLCKLSTNGLLKRAQISALSRSVYSSDRVDGSPLLPPAERDRQAESIARNGVAFVDLRPDTDVYGVEKFAMDVLLDQSFKSLIPHAPAKAKVVRASQSPISVTIIPSRFRRGARDNANLYFTEDAFSETNETPLIIEADSEFDDKSILESLGSSRKSLSTGVYLIHDGKDTVYGPLVIDGKADADGAYRCRQLRMSNGDTGMYTRSYHSTAPKSIILADKPGEFRSLADTLDEYEVAASERDFILIVPSDAKFVEIRSEFKSDDESDPLWGCRPKKNLRVGTAETVDLRQLRSVSNTIAKKAAGHYSFDRVEVNRSQAMLALVHGYGLREKVAEDLLADVERSGRISFMRKTAAGPIAPRQDPTAVFPMMEGPTGFSDNSRNPYVIDEPEAMYQDQAIDVPRELTDEEAGLLDAPDGYPASPEGNNMMGPGIPQAGQEVMNSGVQGPTDVSVLASLVANARIDGVLSAAAAQLLQGNSELGKVLLLMYAHRSAFEDIYSENDMKPLEDTLLTAFENSGDAYLRLKAKATLSDPSMDAAVPFDYTVETP